MIRKRQWFHEKKRRFYESWLNSEAEGQHDPVVEARSGDLMAMAARRLNETKYFCEVYDKLEKLIVWGFENNLQIDDLYKSRVDCYHDDDYWEGCCHLEYCCNAPLE
jgi:hypothetical protein